MAGAPTTGPARITGALAYATGIVGGPNPGSCLTQMLVLFDLQRAAASHLSTAVGKFSY